MKTWSLLLLSAMVMLLAASAWADPTPTISTRKDIKNIKGSTKHISKHIARASVAASGVVSSGPIGLVTNPIFSSGPVGGAATDFQGSMKISQEGDALAEQGDWSGAVLDYQRARMLWTENNQAIYGLGKAAQARGDTASAIGYYRQHIYASDPTRYGTNAR